ncbi:hypothetical protein POM88_036551 [Heracleum sosnowskyi]|uniref:Uncharacterized protein n=1 Tax=Heracleum sosnowskyi TaxID=360622 RepID=A0AAD8MF52_9APIA|nr:hypothetical protein POM88_036551 [Heracleum sosnowskyi]
MHRLLEQHTAAKSDKGFCHCRVMFWTMLLERFMHKEGNDINCSCKGDDDKDRDIYFFKRHQALQTRCSYTEIGDLALGWCDFANSCLNLLMEMEGGQLSFTKSLNHVLSKTSEDIMASVRMLSWAIWWAKNDLVWNGKVGSAYEVVRLAKSSLDEYLSAENSIISMNVKKKEER